MSLSADRLTPFCDGVDNVYPVAATTTIYAGSLVCLDASGNAVPGSVATTLTAVGKAQEHVANTGGAAAAYVKVRAGIFGWANGNAVTKANIGDAAWIDDDETVSSVSTGKSLAGVITAVDANFVYVMTNPATVGVSPSGVFAIANNLSEGTAGTIRTNIGLASAANALSNLGVGNKHTYTIEVRDLKNVNVVGCVAGVAGTISKIYSVLKGAALASGDATLTGKINGSAITTGVVTITQAGSAIGDLDNCTPSAQNVVAAGQEIQFLVGGSNTDTTAYAVITVVVTEG